MNNETVLKEQEKLVHHLAALLEKNGLRVRCIQTHISWVLVTRQLAYKIRKAVQFDFLDFSTLAARRHDCDEELRLNRKLAPGLYLEVVAITGSADQPALDGSGEAIEYAVAMRAFSQRSLWTYRLRRHRLTTAEIDQLAILLARFHHDAAVAGVSSSYGTPEAIVKTADDTLAHITSRITAPPQRDQLDQITAWQLNGHQQLLPLFALRKAGGFVRECHGDLHSANILTEHGQVIPFDCLEFDAQLRWIDVLSEMAFILMDLQFHARPDLANRLLNRYLEVTGDYKGVAVLRYYQVQRALVRCNVALLRAGQHAAASRDATALEQQARDYLAFSAQRLRPAPTALLITHGYAGSGKSTVSGYLAGILGAICIRSDVERKRLYGLTASTGAAAAPDDGIYTEAGTVATYHRLQALARHIIDAGLPVVVDAAFLKRDQRSLFEQLAHALDVPFFILDCAASVVTIRARLAARTGDASDAGAQVLAHQMGHADALSQDERASAIVVDNEPAITRQGVREAIAPVLLLMTSRAGQGDLLSGSVA